jgi:hypothetical protein
MNKITAEHLARRACVYIRQSTPDQVKYNLESKRRQYGLADRARALGWVDIDVIDDDLGISGDGTRRPGFERLLRVLCDGQVGAKQVAGMHSAELAIPRHVCPLFVRERGTKPSKMGRQESQVLYCCVTPRGMVWYGVSTKIGLRTRRSGVRISQGAPFLILTSQAFAECGLH